jgi:ferredoxin-type protein NapH
MSKANPGAAAIAAHGWLAAHRFLLLRRVAQVGFLALFLLGPWAGLWLVKGNLTASRTLDVLPLTDPYVLVQSIVAGYWPEATALIGALIVLAAYVVVGGRAYCAWVCPINPVTDAAHWLRKRLGIEASLPIGRDARLWVLAASLVVAFLTGTVAWEAVNPISLLHRELIFGTIFAGSLAGAVVVAVFLFDLGVASRGWCGHLCPVGAFYGLIGAASVLRVSSVRRAACDDCMDCYAVCPEPQVIAPALKGAAKGLGPVILSRDCTNCGRCIDVCAKDVYAFATRFHHAATEAAVQPARSG